MDIKENTKNSVKFVIKHRSKIACFERIKKFQGVSRSDRPRFIFNIDLTSNGLSLQELLTYRRQGWFDYLIVLCRGFSLTLIYLQTYQFTMDFKFSFIQWVFTICIYVYVIDRWKSIKSVSVITSNHQFWTCSNNSTRLDVLRLSATDFLISSHMEPCAQETKAMEPLASLISSSIKRLIGGLPSLNWTKDNFVFKSWTWSLETSLSLELFSSFSSFSSIDLLESCVKHILPNFYPQTA